MVVVVCACVRERADDPMLAALLALGLDREDAQERCWKVKPGQCVVCLAGGGDDETVLECSYCQRDVCLSCLQRCELCQQLFCSTCAVTKYLFFLFTRARACVDR
jgi:hypothetical protein